MYKVEITNALDSSFSVRSGDYEFSIDTKGKAIAPPAALLASLGTCLGVYIRKYAQTAKLDLGNFRINVEADFSRESPVCFRDIKVRIDLGNRGVDENRKKALLIFISNCPVHNTLKVSPHINVEIV